ncbi:hypothetical protein Scep_030053 [Stephania cephalantha]|uniref:Uncharacterized protein n=1 Tax=Stephania cephalantha TaxID=152367 RepID=A0AAP0E3C4_9MAGN
MMETAAATPARSSDSGKDATQAVARLGGSAGADDSGGPAATAVDDATLAMLGMALVAHKEEERTRKIFLGL